FIIPSIPHFINQNGCSNDRCPTDSSQSPAIGTRRPCIHFPMEVVTMWTAWLLLMLNGLFFTLRLANNTGSCPRALTREEEQDCLTRMAQGDSDARDKLIEHNLRLVAHIVKKYYTQTGDQDDLI